MVVPDVFVGIPVAAWEAVVIAGPDLHKANPPFEQATRHQAFAAEVVHLLDWIDLLVKGRLAMIEAIHPEDVVGFPGNIERFRSGELHPSCQFIASNARGEAIITRVAGRMSAI